MKKADSLNRNVMLRGYAENGYEYNGKVYPLASWKQKDVLSYMRIHKLPQPIRYTKNASGGVSLNEDCLVWCREHEPRDLARILKAFPLAERILFEYDSKQARLVEQTQTKD
jgi:sulfate adenylyltransferase subunit 2